MPIGKCAKKTCFKDLGGRKIAGYLLDQKPIIKPLIGMPNPNVLTGGGDSSLGNKNRPSYYGPRR